jgi:hypothetical protein
MASHRPTPTGTRRAPSQKVRSARTIRFPLALRDRIAADAERCGRSFEAHVLALLRRHYGEDVDLAPPPETLLALARATLAGLSRSDQKSLLTRKPLARPRRKNS